MSLEFNIGSEFQKFPRMPKQDLYKELRKQLPESILASNFGVTHSLTFTLDHKGFVFTENARQTFHFQYVQASLVGSKA